MNGIADMPIQVPIDDPNADTEWNDILRKHKIIPERPPSPTVAIESALQQARELAHEHRYDGKDLDELLASLEDEEDRADEYNKDALFLESYVAKRRAELNALAKREVHGSVYGIQKADYARDVTEASKACPVLVLLTAQGGNDESRLASRLWRELASRWRDVKWCEMRANMCIEGYPDRNCPTVLVYLKGELETQMVRLVEWRGVESTVADVEQWCIKVGVISLEDQRLAQRRGGDEEEEKNERTGRINGGGLRFGGQATGKKARVDDDEDSDWD